MAPQDRSTWSQDAIRIAPCPVTHLRVRVRCELSEKVGVPPDTVLPDVAPVDCEDGQPADDGNAHVAQLGELCVEPHVEGAQRSQLHAGVRARSSPIGGACGQPLPNLKMLLGPASVVRLLSEQDRVPALRGHSEHLADFGPLAGVRGGAGGEHSDIRKCVVVPDDVIEERVVTPAHVRQPLHGHRRWQQRLLLCCQGRSLEAQDHVQGGVGPHDLADPSHVLLVARHDQADPPPPAHQKEQHEGKAHECQHDARGGHHCASFFFRVEG
jgi:hypothetical protein